VVSDNPFAVLTAIVAPAVMTNASSVMCLGTGNRIARVVDRMRVVSAALANLAPSDPDYRNYVAQLERLQKRARLLFLALRILYASLGSFAAAALVSVVGSAMAFYGFELAFRTAAAMGLVAGALAVTGLVSGCSLLVRETRFALHNITEEAEMASARWRTGSQE
jgi:O-antigen ligase